MAQSQGIDRWQAALRISQTTHAIHHLKAARDLLRGAGANKAADYVARALKSAEGAARHARNLDGIDTPR